ncbi:MAG: hypothetical protein ACYC4B_06070 [Pirellulaceae bacterium]
MTNGRSMKRAFLQAIIATLVVTALVGIYVFLFGTFGKTEAKILATTATICYFSTTSLACSATFEKKRHPALSLPGLALGVLGLVFFIPSIWAEWLEVEAAGKAMGVIGALSFSFAQACLLSLAPLQPRHAWVFHAAVALILALAAIISGIIIFEPQDEDLTVRVVGVVAILDGCFSLCVPILHRLGGKQITEKTPQVYSRIELVCPRCGERGIYATGKSTCPECSLVFRVEITDNVR